MTKSKSWFYSTIAISVTLMIAYMSLVALSFRNPASKEPLWIDRCMNKKEEIAGRIIGNKVVFLGGSACLFGIRTKDIQQALNIPVVNMAVHVGLGTDYILHRVKKSLKPGDIVILPFEYELYSYDEIPSTVKLEYLFSYDRDYLFHTSPLTVMRYILSVNRDQIIAAVRLRKEKDFHEPSFEQGGSYTSASLNEHGDETNNKAGKSFESPPLSMPIGELEPRPGLKQVKEFSGYCREHNITLYVSYPNTVYNPEYDKSYYRFYFDTLNDFFVQNHIPVLGKPQMFFYEKSCFTIRFTTSTRKE